KAREQDKRDLAAKLANIDSMVQAGADREAIAAKLRKTAKDWEAALTLSPTAGRQVLRQVLTSPIFIRQAGPRFWKFRCTGTLGKLLGGGFGEYTVPVEEEPNEPGDCEEGAEGQHVTEFNGVGEPSGTRTRDSLLKRQVLYLLS